MLPSTSLGNKERIKDFQLTTIAKSNGVCVSLLPMDFRNACTSWPFTCVSCLNTRSDRRARLLERLVDVPWLVFSFVSFVSVIIKNNFDVKRKKVDY